MHEFFCISLFFFQNVCLFVLHVNLVGPDVAPDVAAHISDGGGGVGHHVNAMSSSKVPLFKGCVPYKSTAMVEQKSSSSPASSVSSAEQILKQIKYHRQQQERELHDFAQSLVDEEPPQQQNQQIDARTKSYLQHTAQQQQLHQQQQQLVAAQQVAQAKNDKNSSSSASRRRLGRHESRYTSGNYKFFQSLSFSLSLTPILSLYHPFFAPSSCIVAPQRNKKKAM